MQIAVLAIGSQGDVRPFTALGAGIAADGHRVTMVTHAEFADLVRSYGLDFAEVRGNPLEIVHGSAGRAWLGSTNNSALFMFRLFRLAGPIIDDIARDMLEGSRGCDAIIYSLPLSIVGVSVAEKLGVPSVSASLYPLHASSAFPSIMTPRLPRLFRRASAALVAQVFWAFFRFYHKRVRGRDFGLPRLSLHSPLRGTALDEGLHLYGYSPSVIPRPPDWPPALAVCGYWFLDGRATWTPQASLLDFLGAGAPPLYVGFGSMAAGDAERMTRIVVDALGKTGRRAVLASGWGGLSADALPDSIFPIGFVPHDWLFPRTAGAIHHGGAGTTAAALRAGTPSIIVPFFADQFFWGKLVGDLGLGSAPIPRRRLSVSTLSAAIESIGEGSGTAERCAAMAASIAKEDGVAAATAALARYLSAAVSG